MPAVSRSRATFILSRTSIVAAVAALIIALAIPPNASASTGSQAITSSSTGQLEGILSTGELSALLSDLPVSDLNRDELVETLAKLPGLETLTSVQGIGGIVGLEKAIGESISALGPTATLGELTEPTKLAETLQDKLNGLLNGLLGGLLGKDPTSGVSEALESLNLGELTSSLIAKANTPQELTGLGTLLDELFAQAGLAKTSESLGVSLTEPVTFLPETVQEVASTLGTDPLTVAQSLGKSAQELPSTALTLTTPVGEGKLLSVLSAVHGLPMNLLSEIIESQEEPAQEEAKTEETSKTPTKEETGASEGPNVTQPTFCSEDPSGSGSAVDLEDLICTEEANRLLSSFPVGELDRAQLVETLAKLPGLGTLIQLQGLGGISGLETALNESIAQLGPSATLGELTDPTKLPETLQSKLTGLLKGLLGGLVGKNPTNVAPETLESLNLGELTSSLISTAATHEQLTDLSTLLDELFARLNKTRLTEALGIPITEPVTFTPQTIQELAITLATNPLALAELLGKSAQELPSTALTLTAPLGHGKLLSVLNSIPGLPMNVLSNLVQNQEEPTQKEEPQTEETQDKETSKTPTKEETTQPENSDENPDIIQVGSGGNGGSSTGSGNPPAQNETINVVLPGTQNVFDTSNAASAAAVAKRKVIKIIGHKVKGSHAKIVVQIPSAGRITITGAHVTKVTHRATKAGRLSLKIKLSSAGASSLKRHRNLLRVMLRAAFKPATGTASTAAISIRFT